MKLSNSHNKIPGKKKNGHMNIKKFNYKNKNR